MCQERKPHKHAELIKAWADGAEIQVMIPVGEWVDTDEPSWSPGALYRIKPKEPIVLYGFLDQTGLRIPGSRWEFDNIKATFCPDTGKLLSVEMI